MECELVQVGSDELVLGRLAGVADGWEFGEDDGVIGVWMEMIGVVAGVEVMGVVAEVVVMGVV